MSLRPYPSAFAPLVRHLGQTLLSRCRPGSGGDGEGAISRCERLGRWSALSPHRLAAEQAAQQAQERARVDPVALDEALSVLLVRERADERPARGVQAAGG